MHNLDLSVSVRAVTKTSSFWVYANTRQGIEDLGNSSGSISSFAS